MCVCWHIFIISIKFKFLFSHKEYNTATYTTTTGIAPEHKQFNMEIPSAQVFSGCAGMITGYVLRSLSHILRFKCAHAIILLYLYIAVIIVYWPTVTYWKINIKKLYTRNQYFNSGIPTYQTAGVSILIEIFNLIKFACSPLVYIAAVVKNIINAAAY